MSKHDDAERRAYISIPGWDTVNDMLVVICPACKERTSVWLDLSEGPPDRLSHEECRHCGKLFDAELEWEWNPTLMNVELVPAEGENQNG